MQIDAVLIESNRLAPQMNQLGLGVLDMDVIMKIYVHKSVKQFFSRWHVTCQNRSCTQSCTVQLSLSDLQLKVTVTYIADNTIL